MAAAENGRYRECVYLIKCVDLMLLRTVMLWPLHFRIGPLAKGSENCHTDRELAANSASNVVCVFMSCFSDRVSNT